MRQTCECGVTSPALWVESTVPCKDPECAEQGGVGEPDGDTEVHYFVCNVCGFEFGYEQIKQSPDTCQLGVPESVRKVASSGMEAAIAAEQKAQPVPISIGRRPAEGSQ